MLRWYPCFYESTVTILRLRALIWYPFAAQYRRHKRLSCFGYRSDSAIQRAATLKPAVTHIDSGFKLGRVSPVEWINAKKTSPTGLTIQQLEQAMEALKS